VRLAGNVQKRKEIPSTSLFLLCLLAGKRNTIGMKEPGGRILEPTPWSQSIPLELTIPSDSYVRGE